MLLQRQFLMGRAASCTDAVFSLIVICEFNVGELLVVFCDTQNNNKTTLFRKPFSLSVRAILTLSIYYLPANLKQLRIKSFAFSDIWSFLDP